MRTLGDALQYCKASTNLAESELIVAAALEKLKGVSPNRLELYGDLNQELDHLTIELIKSLTEERVRGQTLQYLTGKQRFLDHDYQVGKGVLVPRPETELLVTTAVEFIKTENLKHGIEIGIGSGAISIELLSQIRALTMTASEVSDEALKYASRNALSILDIPSRLQIHKIYKLADVLETLIERNQKPADFIISNPPYLAMDDEISAEVIENEPHAALFPINHPSYFYDEIAEKGAHLLTPNGRIFVEIPEMRSDLITYIFANQGWEAEIRKDLNGRDRVLIAKRNIN